MVKLADIELVADQDVSKGNKISIFPLFSNTEGWKNFRLLENVEGDKTRIKVTIAKAGSLQTKAGVTKRPGEDTNLSMLLNRKDFAQKLKATNDIKKGEKLIVTLEKE